MIVEDALILGSTFAPVCIEVAQLLKTVSVTMSFIFMHINEQNSTLLRHMGSGGEDLGHLTDAGEARTGWATWSRGSGGMRGFGGGAVLLSFRASIGLSDCSEHRSFSTVCSSQFVIANFGVGNMNLLICNILTPKTNLLNLWDNWMAV